MSRITLTFENGSSKEFDRSIPIHQAVKEAFPDLSSLAVAAVVNGKITDLSDRLDSDATIRLLTHKDAEGLQVYWHSSSHILAQAVQALFPGTQLGIGPSIANGFYYDFKSDRTITVDDLPAIEAKMKEIVKGDQRFEKQMLSKADAMRLFRERKEDFKVELLEDLTDGEISVYRNGSFVDLCRGPHLRSTSKVKHFKLLSVAGSYWRGDEHNAVLQRIYGISFPDAKTLEEHLTALEEAKKRDHRRIGKDQDLFSFQAEAPGFPFWHPNGMVLYEAATRAVRELLSRDGYREIKTPVILNETLWHRSGHWDHYKENMYFTTIDEQPYAVKPMNCPGCLLVYKNDPRSYRDLPVKFSEMGLVHRHEKSGVLHGLFRVRQFTQDDAHVFCTPEQLEGEIIKIIDLIAEVYGLFGFEKVALEVSTRPVKSIGSDDMWKLAENALIQALQRKSLPFKMNPGEGAFYGPKIDYHIQDSLGRTWQCGTIQVDFSMPERFDLEYTGADGTSHRPVMIHRAILGSVERFIGILIEHYGGAFPAWLAPVQCVLIPISEKHHAYAQEILRNFRTANIRCRVDDRNEKMGYRIREAEKMKIPYMAVFGDKEAENRSVSVRKHGKGDLGSVGVADFIRQIQDETTRRANH